MPTRNRRRVVEQAIACFLAQDYPDRELVIVDNGEPIYDIVPQSPTIRYEHVGGRHRSTGWMRNRACEMARGEVIAHWDDDDFSGPQRLSEQVEVLQQSRCSATGYNVLPFAWDDGQRAWLYLGSSGYACGTSLCYLRSYWAGHQFKDLLVGEDNEFIRGMGGQLASVSGRSIVARVHSAATCQGRMKLLTGSQWTGARGQNWKEIPYRDLALWGYPCSV